MFLIGVVDKAIDKPAVAAVKGAIRVDVVAVWTGPIWQPLAANGADSPWAARADFTSVSETTFLRNIEIMINKINQFLDHDKFFNPTDRHSIDLERGLWAMIGTSVGLSHKPGVLQGRSGNW